MKLENLMNSLNIKDYPEILQKNFESAMKEYENRGNEIVNAKYLTGLNNEYKLFDRYWKDVLQASKEAENYPELVRFIYLLKHLLKDDNLTAEVLPCLEFPVSNIDSLVFDMAPLFSMLAFVPSIFQHMKSKDIPNNIIYDTLSEFEFSIDAFYDRNKRPGFNKRYTKWQRGFINHRIIRIGRFNFEMKNEYSAPVTVFKN